MEVLFCTPEVVPFSKTGGLGDVSGALPRALAALGVSCRVITPLYGSIRPEAHGLRLRLPGYPVPLPGGTGMARLWEGRLEERVPVYFVEYPPYFGRAGLYGERGEDYPDNLERFAFFSRAVLEALRHLDWVPQILHCHDWQTALIPVYLRIHYRFFPFEALRTVLTLHNLGYQGIFEAARWPHLGLPDTLFQMQGLEFYGKINLLKGGILFADLLNTVSPTYSQEIQTPEFGHGLEGVLQERREVLWGILNGVDYQTWDPSRDPWIAQPYHPRALQGKGACKKALQEEMGLPQTAVPLLAMVSRLDEQKGIDLLGEILLELMHLDLQLVLVGVGRPEYHRWLEAMSRKYPEKFRIRLVFDEALTHRVQAGADLMLIPSRYEPCGLVQLYSLRYGTLPVAHRTGGLADTIVDFVPSTWVNKKATGFLFDHYSGRDFLKAVLLALQVYQNRRLWRQLMTTAMRADFSWEQSARAYLKLYQEALSGSPKPQTNTGR